MSLSPGDITISDGYKATYTVSNLITFNNPGTDTMWITGSATKTIRVLRIGFSGTRTFNGLTEIQLLKRSTANTGGTSIAVTATPGTYNSSNPAFTAGLFSTAGTNPTLGALVGIIRSTKINMTAAAPTGAKQPEYIWNFRTNYSQAPVLRGTGELIAISLNKVVITGGETGHAFIEWTEE